MYVSSIIAMYPNSTQIENGTFLYKIRKSYNDIRNVLINTFQILISTRNSIQWISTYQLIPIHLPSIPNRCTFILHETAPQSMQLRLVSENSSRITIFMLPIFSFLLFPTNVRLPSRQRALRRFSTNILRFLG